jgi:hypothetical protein
MNERSPLHWLSQIYQVADGTTGLAVTTLSDAKAMVEAIGDREDAQ